MRAADVVSRISALTRACPQVRASARCIHGAHALGPSLAGSDGYESPEPRLVHSALMHAVLGSDLSRYNKAGTVFAGFHYGAQSSPVTHVAPAAEPAHA